MGISESPSSLWVHSHFASWQGTGHLLGTRQYFVRLAGCSVKACPIRRVCDEPAALVQTHGSRLDAARLAGTARASEGGGGWLHVTGGEPTDQPEGLAALLKESYRLGLKTQIQTSGVAPVDLPFDWLTVSPKTDDLAQTFGHELVVIHNGQKATDLRRLASETRYWFYYLCPRSEGGQESDMADFRRLLDELRHGPVPWQATIQAHKHWSVR